MSLNELLAQSVIDLASTIAGQSSRFVPNRERCSCYTQDLSMRCVWFEAHDGDCAYGSAQADPPFLRVD